MNRRILFTLVLSVFVALFLVAGVHAAEVKLIAGDGDARGTYSAILSPSTAIMPSLALSMMR
jgi:hypothetical protein